AHHPRRGKPEVRLLDLRHRQLLVRADGRRHDHRRRRHHLPRGRHLQRHQPAHLRQRRARRNPGPSRHGQRLDLRRRHRRRRLGHPPQPRLPRPHRRGRHLPNRPQQRTRPSALHRRALGARRRSRRDRYHRRLPPVEKTVDRPRTPTGWRWPLVVLLAGAVAAWLPLYLQRRRAHQPNVDDYLYTLVSRQIAHAGSFSDVIHALLHTGQTAPLVVALSAPLAVHGVDAAAAVELPLLFLLAASAWLLARRWISPWPAA